MNQSQPADNSEQSTMQLEPLEHPVDPAKRFSWGRSFTGFLSGGIIGLFFLGIFFKYSSLNRYDVFGLNNSRNRYGYDVALIALSFIPFFAMLCAMYGGLAGGSKIFGIWKFMIIGMFTGVVAGALFGGMIYPEIAYHFADPASIYFISDFLEQATYDGIFFGVSTGALSGITIGAVIYYLRQPMSSQSKQYD